MSEKGQRGVNEYRLLGPLDVRRDGESLDIGARQRALLALLLIEPNRVVSTDRIIDELWGDDAGRDHQNALWVQISRLRSVLDPARAKRSDGSVLVTRPPGYVLVVDSERIDSHRFESLAREGRALLDTDPGAASLVLSEALALWRGRALEEFTYEQFAAAEIAHLEELRLAAVGDRADADLRAGRHQELIGELDGLVRLHPSHERFTELLMLALHRSGRQSDALRAFGDRRKYLVEELGLDPSRQLVELEQQILNDDPRLRIEPRAATDGAEHGLSVRGYELREKIGVGTTGDVYSAFQPSVGREVAIKVIRPELADDPSFIRRFEAEARLVAHLEHAAIVPVYDYWREPGQAFLVMRRFERGNLDDVMRQGALETSTAARIIEQLGAALTAAHRQGIAHGDMTPRNVLIDGDGNAFLADFGMSALGSVRDAGSDDLGPTVEPTVAADIAALAELADLLVGGTDARSAAGAVIDRARGVDTADGYASVAAFVTELSAAWGQVPLVGDGDAPNPYRGLRAFGEDDAHRFFGRERHVERLLARLGYAGPKGRFAVVVGPSGSGKSSVVRAGLIPALRRRAIPGSDEWFIVAMTPGREPFEALAEALRSVAVEPPDDLAGRLRTSGMSSTVELVAPDDTAQIVIVIDQLEELFSQTPPETAAEFMSAVVEATTARHSIVKIVATLRADFYDQPLAHHGFGELVRIGTEVITPMNPQELERAITGPAESVGVTIEPGVVAAIASDMSGQPGGLPLMQYALTELFDQRTGSTIAADAYHDLGGVAGALARRAESIYEALTPDERDGAREAFLRLVTLGDGSADTRRRALVSEVTAAAGTPVTSVIDEFARHRLITFDRDPVTRGPTVEIAHESLISQWGRLADWVDAGRADVLTQRQLAAAAADWAERGADPDFLLAGNRLGRYDGWLDDAPVRLTAHERRFLDESFDRSQVELVAERQRVSRLRRLVVGVAAALVVALVAGAFAVRQRQIANDEAARAETAAAEAVAQADLAVQQRERADDEAQRAETAAAEAVAAAEDADLATLISRSAAAKADDPPLALLLALEARHRSPGRATDLAVLDALGGATIANRVLTRDRLDSDCSTSFFIDNGHEITNVDGRIIRRDAVSGLVIDDAPSPAPCALGTRSGEDGLAATIDLARIFTGPNFENELEIAEPTFPIFPATGRFLALTGLVDIDVPDSITLRDSVSGDVIGDPITGDIQISLAMNADESLFAVGFARPEAPEGDGRLVIADGRTAEIVAQLDTPDGAEAIRFDESTGNLIAGFLGGRVMVIEPTTGAIVSDLPTRPGQSFSDIAARPDGTIVAVSPRGVIEVDPTSGQVTDTLLLQDYEDAFIRPDGLIVVVLPDGIVVYDPDGSALVERSWNVDPGAHVAFTDGRAATLDIPGQTIEIVELATGERFEPVLTDEDGSPFRALVAYPEPDGVWAMSSEFAIARWENDVLADRLYLGSVPGVTGVIGARTLLATRFGDLFAAIGVRPDGQQEVTLARLVRGGPEVVLTIETTDAIATHPRPDGGLYVADRDGILRTYSPTGDLISEIDTGAPLTYEMALDPAGSTLVMSSDNARTVLVRTDIGDVDDLGVIGRIVNFGFDRDGALAALAYLDGTIRLLDVERAEPAGVVWSGTGNFIGETGWYNKSSDTLWMSTADRLIEIPLDPERWVERACGILSRELTPAEWERLVPGDEPQRPACG